MQGTFPIRSLHLVALVTPGRTAGSATGSATRMCMLAPRPLMSQHCICNHSRGGNELAVRFHVKINDRLNLECHVGALSHESVSHWPCGARQMRDSDGALTYSHRVQYENQSEHQAARGPLALNKPQPLMIHMVTEQTLSVALCI